MTNLISNASKYSPEGSTIGVSMSVTNGTAVIEVVDRGIGISLNDQGQLFTPFFRADNSETRQEPGTGLGLLICKQIVELHGGKISVRSSRGRGTTVRVELPTVLSSEQSVYAA